jgi:hypothetical protein
MKNYIVKRIKDGQFLLISERDLKITLNTQTWENGKGFVKQFELIGEEKDRSEEMKELFDDEPKFITSELKLEEVKPEMVEPGNVLIIKKRGRPKKIKTE